VGRLIGLIVVAFVLYQGYQYAGPWIERQLETESASGGGGEQEESARCVARARNASRSLSDAMRQFSQPPVRQQEWTSAFLSVSSDVNTAESACMCSTEACDRGYAAVSELRSLSLSLDGVVRGGSQGFSNPARALERVHELLDEADELAG
jgi:hypothetical protein